MLLEMQDSLAVFNATSVADRDEPVIYCEPTFTPVNCLQVSRVPSPERCQPIHPGQGGLQHCALRCCLWAPAVLGTGECSFGKALSAEIGCACARIINPPHGCCWSSLDNKKSVKTCNVGQ